jgi:membrane-bound lytic murein transglycosylase B
MRLREEGVAENTLAQVYGSKEMPIFSFVPFRLNPRESSNIYGSFLRQDRYRLGAQFIRTHAAHFSRMEKLLRVPKAVVTAILVVETGIGENTGSQQVLYRLSRVASVGDPQNLTQNLAELQRTDPTVTMEAVAARAVYLEKTFLPEIPALLKIAQRNRFNPLKVRGSIAGAFGLPQFLPSAFLRFGYDGDRNGTISLFNEVDALWSTANYLASFGLTHETPLPEQRTVLWNYNKSDPYIDTILAVSRGITEELRNPSPAPPHTTKRPPTPSKRAKNPCTKGCRGRK